MQTPGRNRGSEERVIPESLFQAYIRILHEFTISAKDSASIPSFINPLKFYYSTVIAFLSLFYFDNYRLWEKGLPISNLVHYVGFLYRWGTNVEGAVGSPILAIAAIILFFIIEIPNIIVLCSPGIRSRPTRGFCTVYLIVNNFIKDLVLLWIPSIIGTAIGNIVTTEIDAEGTMAFVLSLLLLVFFFIGIIDKIYIYCPAIEFAAPQTIYWDSKFETITLVDASINLLFTRVIEMVPDMGLIVPLYVVLLSLNLVFIIILMLRQPFLQAFHDAIYVGGLCGALFLTILLLPQAVLHYIDSVALFLIGIIFICGTTMLALWVNKRKASSYLAQLDAQELTYKSQFNFLKIVETGFKNADPYVLSWVPFSDALQKWDSPRILMIWSRMLAVYPEETPRLMQIEAHIKELKKTSVYWKCYRRLIKRVISSRNQHLSKKIKTTFKSLDEKIRAMKNLLVTYWLAVSEGNASTCYDLGHKLQAGFNDIEADLAELVKQYPNNSSVSLKYANFLQNVVCHPLLAEQWKLRSESLKNSAKTMDDVCHSLAMACFRVLPETLDSLNPFVDVANPSFGTDLSSDNEFNEDQKDYSASYIRKLGLSAPIPVIKLLMIATVAFMIIAFVVGALLPLVYLMINISSQQDTFDTSVMLSEFISYLTEVTLNIFVDGATKNDRWPENEEVYKEIVGSQDGFDQLTPIEDRIGTLINQTEEKITTFLSSFGTRLSTDSLALNQTLNGEIDLLAFESDPATTYTVKSQQALTVVEAFLYSYDKTNMNMINDVWFKSLIGNVKVTSNEMSNINEIISDDFEIQVEGMQDTMLIFVIIFAVITVISSPFFIYNTFNVTKGWKNVVRNIASLPKVSIQKTVQRYTVGHGDTSVQLTEEEKHVDIDTFVQIVASRSLSGGVPIVSIIILYVVMFVLSLVEYIAIYILACNTTEHLYDYPFSIFVTSEQKRVADLTAIDLVREVLVTEGRSFSEDNATSVTKELIDDLTDIIITYEDFVSGTEKDHNIGIVSSTEDITDYILTPLGKFLDQSNVLTRIQAASPIIQIEVFIGIATQLVDNIATGTTYDSDNKDLLFMVEYILYFMKEAALYPITQKYTELYDSKATEAVMSIMLTAIAFIVIGIIAGIVIIFQERKISDSMRFALSSLSMIDSKYINDSPAVLGVLSGNFSENFMENTTTRLTYETLNLKLKEWVIVVDEALHVSAINECAKTAILGANHLMAGTHINILIKFESSEVMEAIKAFFSFRAPSKTDYECDVTVLSTNKAHHLRISLFKAITNEGKSEVVIILKEKPQLEVKSDEYNLLEVKDKEMRMEMIPEKFRTKIDVLSEEPFFSSHNFVALSLSPIYKPGDDLMKQNDILYRVVTSASQDYAHSCVLPHREMQVTVCFDLEGTISKNLQLIADAFATARKIKRECKTSGVEVQCGMVLGKRAVVGSLAKFLPGFLVYSQAIDHVGFLSRNALPGHVIADTKCSDLMQADVLRNAKVVQLPNGESLKSIPL